MSPHLLVHVYEDRVQACLVGARTVFVDRPTRHRQYSVLARFRPGCLPVLTGGSACELTDRAASLDEVWGGEGRRLVHRLEGLLGPSRPQGVRVESPTPCGSAAIELLGDFIAGVAGPRPEVDWRARWLRRAARSGAGSVSVGRLARAMGLGVRTLRQVASDWCGLSPKRFARIHRLFATLDMGLFRRPRWAEVAVACGYSDQSHMIREYRALLGETPEAFRRRGHTREPGRATR